VGAAVAIGAKIAIEPDEKSLVCMFVGLIIKIDFFSVTEGDGLAFGRGIKLLPPGYMHGVCGIHMLRHS
jgi:hypothetical protein